MITHQVLARLTSLESSITPMRTHTHTNTNNGSNTILRSLATRLSACHFVLRWLNLTTAIASLGFDPASCRVMIMSVHVGFDPKFPLVQEFLEHSIQRVGIQRRESWLNLWTAPEFGKHLFISLLYQFWSFSQRACSTSQTVYARRAFLSWKKKPDRNNIFRSGKLH